MRYIIPGEQSASRNPVFFFWISIFSPAMFSRVLTFDERPNSWLTCLMYCVRAILSRIFVYVCLNEQNTRNNPKKFSSGWVEHLSSAITSPSGWTRRIPRTTVTVTIILCRWHSQNNVPRSRCNWRILHEQLFDIFTKLNAMVDECQIFVVASSTTD